MFHSQLGIPYHPSAARFKGHLRRITETRRLSLTKEYTRTNGMGFGHGVRAAVQRWGIHICELRTICSIFVRSRGVKVTTSGVRPLIPLLDSEDDSLSAHDRERMDGLMVWSHHRRDWYGREPHPHIHQSTKPKTKV